MGPHLHVPALHGALVRLERLSGHHADELAAAADYDRSAFAFTWVPHGKRRPRSTCELS
jgi:hypothetical protein